MNPYEPYAKVQPDDLREVHWTSPDKQFSYVLVPKCASSSLIEGFKDIGWERHEGQGIYFSVVRDPVERWVSGMTQSFYRIGKICKRLLKEDLTPFVDDPWFDLHQSPQHWYFRNLPNAVLYKIENIEQLREWLIEQGVVVPELIRKNVAKQYAPRRVLYERIQNALTEEHRAKLRAFYAADVILYNEAR